VAPGVGVQADVEWVPDHPHNRQTLSVIVAALSMETFDSQGHSPAPECPSLADFATAQVRDNMGTCDGIGGAFRRFEEVSSAAHLTRFSKRGFPRDPLFRRRSFVLSRVPHSSAPFADEWVRQIVTEPESGDPSVIMKVIKQHFTRTLRRKPRVYVGRSM
jgi:hypothetical protein